MPHIRLTVDGAVLMDGAMGEWTSTPPEILTEQLKANIRPKPYMRAVLMVIADAAIGEYDTDISVHTSDAEWTITVHSPTLKAS